MAEKNSILIKGAVQNKRKTEAEWYADVYDQNQQLRDNPFIPKNGQIVIFESTDSKIGDKLKVGDGVRNVMDLPFSSSGSGGGGGGTSQLEELLSLGGSKRKSIKIGDGSLSSETDYSIVGGTNDKTVISNIIGSLASSGVKINAPSISADCGISFGSGTEVISTGGISIGVWNTSGVKGYYWSNITFSEGTATITLSANQNSLVEVSPTDWRVGDTISIVNGSKYPACAKITNIDGNLIEVDSLPFTSIASVSLKTPDDNTIFACYKKEEVKYSILGKVVVENYRWYPRGGAVELGWAGTAIGIENFVSGSGGFASGWNNWQAGDFGAIFGRDNIGGYGSLTYGGNNRNSGTYSLVGGSGNIVSSNQSIVGGSGNTIASGNVLAGGANHSITDGSSCTVVGGDTNVLTKSWCAAVFGNKNTNSGNFSLVSGQNNTITNGNCVAVSGIGNTVSANNVLVGGTGNVVTDANALVSGSNNKSTSHCNIVCGEGNTITGNDSAIFGQGNNSAGSQTFMCALNGVIATNCGQSAVFGENNIVGSDTEITLPDGTKSTKTSIVSSLTTGKNNKIYASYSIAGGQSNTIWNGNAAVFGYNNQAQGASTIIGGDGNIANTWCQAVFGRYCDNNETKNDLLVIGNGTNNNNVIKRSNALRLTSSGDIVIKGKVTTGTNPTGDMDVVNLSFLKNYLLDKEW